MNWLEVWILSVIVSSSCWASKKSRPKSITTLIDAKWPSTPVLLEVAEYLAEESQASFWGYVDGVSEFEEDFIRYKTDKEKYEFSLSEASRFISLGQISLLKLSLALRNYSVTVETHQQMALDRQLPTNCLAVADVNGKLTCNPNEVESLIRERKGERKPEMFLADHHYSEAADSAVGVVLYGELSTTAFKKFHVVLQKLAEDGQVDYVLRHYLKERPQKRVRLSGYGVELQIKSTEYKAQDDTKVKEEGGSESGEEDSKEEEDVEGFRFGKLRELYPSEREQLESLKNFLLESSGEMAPLKVWQLQELSLQAAQRIVSSPRDETLKVLAQISQNFPIQTRSLVRTVVTEELREEIKQNREYFIASLSLHPNDAAIFINGMFYDVELTDVFTLVDVVKQELKALEGLHKIGVEEEQLTKLLALDFTANNEEYAVDIRDSAVLYVNDIEQDKQYRRWPGSILEMLRPTYPGMLKTVRKNMYHLVLILDPAKELSKPLLKMAEAFVVHNAPLRIGIVFAVNPDPTVTGLQDPGVALLNAFNYVAEAKGERYHGLGFITDVYAAVKDGPVTVAEVKRLLLLHHPDSDPEDILGEGSEYDVGRQLAQDFTYRMGLRRFPQALLNGVPLPEKDLAVDRFEEAVLTALVTQTGNLQRAVFKGELAEQDVVIDYLMSLPNVMPRLNERILYAKSEFLDITGDPLPTLDWSLFMTLTPRDMTATLIRHLAYLARKTTTTMKPITHWIVTDVETVEGRDLLKKAMEQMKDTNQVRLTFIPNPSLDAMQGPLLLTHAVYAALESLSLEDSRDFVTKLMQENTAKAIQDGIKQPSEVDVGGIDMTAFSAVFDASKSSQLLQAYHLYCQKTLKFRPGQMGVISNGKVIGPLDEGERFEEEDFNLLERFTMASYGNRLMEELREIEDDSGKWDGNMEEDSNTAFQVAALLASHPQTKPRTDVVFRQEEHSVIKLPPRILGQPALDIVAIMDPLSRGAQKMSSLLSVLQEVVNCRIRLFLNCVEKHSEMPLKSFYRFVLDSEPQFTSQGSLTSGPMARFHNMPESPVLTQNLHVPEHWLVEVVRSSYDLDNIHLEEVDSVVHSEFELEYLLVEGQCHEQHTGTPPRGLQITLGTKQNPVEVDTIVMANLGYFQLKARPGAWILRLRQGRSSDIYDIVSHENSDTPPNSTDIMVVVGSFRSLVVKLKVAKRPGKEHTDLLYEDDEEKGIWGTITSSFSGSKLEEVEDNRINIFSVASGHLYERFLRIMMLSVMKHTKTPVKFWFLKNYLSPTFKDFLPHMANKYGFEYELVQYKWPRWLHQQTEKQRLIWGYKILFLDVLFPLDVRKIIFVDADQVVRADLKELRDFDLGAAPYGYTPFCDSRKEMDGFRFWNQGYWKSHLQGRKYHISALYVVDLKRFRRVAAGDRLRGQYQALSMDPNSLSNLDQDLPNNMIHQVAIKSLPQEWLWCETWCDDQSKKYAKTIDLCNNPLTKEAKLSAAMRIVSEWKDYDTEVKKLQEKVIQQQRENQERERLREEAEEAQARQAEKEVIDRQHQEGQHPAHDDL